MKRLLFFVLLSAFLGGCTGHSENEGKRQAGPLVLEDIYGNGTYSMKGINAMRWLYGNSSYTVLEGNKSVGGRDIVRYNVENGKREVVVSASDLIPAGTKKPLMISDYRWSEDNAKLLIFTNTKRVWRLNTKGDYWVYDMKSKALRQVGKGLDASCLMFAKFSPAADKVAYVYKNNIYSEDVVSGRRTQLTFDGSDIMVNGTFDWVYEEELSCRDGFRWSTDGKSIIYWNSDTRGTGKFTLINNIDSLYSKPIVLPYPKVGTTNSAVRIGVVDLSSRRTRWFDIPGDPRNNYLARMDVIPGTDEVMIQQLNRLQNTNKVYVCNIRTMSVNNIYTDKDEAFLDVHDNIMWLEGNRYFTWTSEKDGWMHLYKVSKDGKQESLITKGDFDVVNISCIDPANGYVYYIASPGVPTERYLYRSRLDGSGKAERITPKDFKGHNSYQISGDGLWAVHTFQNTGTPNMYSIVNLPAHKSVRVLEDNKVLREKIAALKLTPKEFFRVKVSDGLELDGWMIKPKNFDSSKKYPVIVHIYGEPAGSTVQNNWGGGELYSHYLAQDGYIVMSIDPRGTRVPRGREWRKSIYGKIGIVAVKDHAEAMKQVIETYPFIDASRIGIWGWSGGGQMTLNMLFKHPEIYSVGIAVAFVCDQKLYDTIYQERYMGLPSENKEGYYEGSPVNFAKNLQGKLMVIHGTADDNVHYQSFETLTNTLIKYKKHFSMMSYPMRSHSINEREGTSYHLYMTMEQFWLNNLEPGAK